MKILFFHEAPNYESLDQILGAEERGFLFSIARFVDTALGWCGVFVQSNVHPERAKLTISEVCSIEY